MSKNEENNISLFADIYLTEFIKYGKIVTKKWSEFYGRRDF